MDLEKKEKNVVLAGVSIGRQITYVMGLLENNRYLTVVEYGTKKNWDSLIEKLEKESVDYGMISHSAMYNSDKQKKIKAAGYISALMPNMQQVPEGEQSLLKEEAKNNDGTIDATILAKSKNRYSAALAYCYAARKLLAEGGQP